MNTENVVKPSAEELSKEKARREILFKLGKLSEVAVHRAANIATRNITDQVRDFNKKYETYVADARSRLHRGEKTIEKSYRAQINDLERKMHSEIVFLREGHEMRVREAQKLLSEFCGVRERSLNTCLDGVHEVDRHFCASIEKLPIDVLKELQEKGTVKTPTITLDVPTEHSLSVLCECLVKDDQPGLVYLGMSLVDDENS